MNKLSPKTNDEQQNTPETETPLNLPPFKKYTKNDLEFNVFTPKKDIFYFFISELTEPSSFILEESHDTLFKLNFSSDVQRFCYYPGTKNIYTFLGFKTDDQRSKAMKNKMVINSSYENIVTKYPFKEIPPKRTRKRQKLKKDNKQQENPTELPKFNKYTDNDIEFTDFIPKNNLVYLFFAEISKPTNSKIKNQSDKYHGIDYSLDIQKYHYYPGTKNIYTFMGFSNQQLAENASKILKGSVLDQSVYMYPHQSTLKAESQPESKPPQEQSEILNFDDFYTLKINKIPLPKFNAYSKSDLEFQEFKPKENLYYLFFAEQLEPTKSILNSHYDQLYSIKKASDIQRFRFYPKTKNIYTYIGFRKKNTMIIFKRFAKLIEYAVDKKVFIYPYSLNFKGLRQPKRRNNQHAHPHRAPRPNSTTNPNANTNLQNLENSKNSDSIKNSVDLEGPFFEPKHGFYYLRFKETNDDNRNVRYENKKLFGVDNVNDIQRGFRFRDNNNNNDDDEDTKSYFTFFGFDTLERRASALDSLKKLRSSVDTSSIKEINDFDFDYDYEVVEDDDDEIEYVDDYEEDFICDGSNVRIIEEEDDDDDDDDSEDDDAVDFDDDDDDADDNGADFDDDDDKE